MTQRTLVIKSKNRRVILPLEHKDRSIDEVLSLYRGKGWDVYFTSNNPQTTETWYHLSADKVTSTESML